jgi:hypothetical protein
MNAFEKLIREVRHLDGQVRYQENRRFVEMPNGWEALQLITQRAVLSAHRAMFGEPNYTRLELAKRELEDVL